MANNFFDEDSEYMSEEQAEELAKEAAKAPLPKQYAVAPAPQELPEEAQDWISEPQYEEFSDEDLANDQELLTDVSLRLEQGRLYEMILKHDLFQDVDATPKAIANVQREIRQHIKGRLAVLLGLKPDSQMPVQSRQQDFPFSPLEVNLLKTWLAKLSNGATEKYKELPPEIKKENKLNSVVEQKSQTLKPLSTPKSVQKITVKAPVQNQVPAQRAAPQRPLPRPKGPKSRMEQIKDLKMELEATAKPFVEMTPQEVQARNLKISELEKLEKPPRPANALPMPSLDQANSVYSQMASSTTENMLRGSMGRAINGK